MIILRIDDVGRLPTDSPEQGSDRDLSWFKGWYISAGLSKLPCVCGVTPDWLDKKGFESVSWLADNGAIIAAHGTNHHIDASITREEMIRIRGVLGHPRAYIPPFNYYDLSTIRNWKEAGGDILFGGFNNEHHQLGDKPNLVDGVLHYSACKTLYDRAVNLEPTLSQLKPYARYPLVMTLHAPWESTPTHVAKLVELVSSMLVSPSIADGALWQ